MRGPGSGHTTTKVGGMRRGEGQWGRRSVTVCWAHDDGGWGRVGGKPNRERQRPARAWGRRKAGCGRTPPGTARQERAWPHSGLGHHEKARNFAQCPQRPGFDHRSEGAPRRHAMTRTGDANHRQLLGEPKAWAFSGREPRRSFASSCRWKKGLSLQPAGAPRGEPLGELGSIPLRPPGQGRDPQVSQVETLESNYALECAGRRRGMPSHRRGCVRASPECRATRAATIAWRRQPTALRAGRRGRDHPEPP